MPFWDDVQQQASSRKEEKREAESQGVNRRDGVGF